MFNVNVTGKGRNIKLHATTLDGRRLCRCKYRAVTRSFQAINVVDDGAVCPESLRNTHHVPSVREREDGTCDVSVLGIGCSLYARDKAGAVDLLQRLGFGAYRFARVTDPMPRATARVLTIAEREEQASISRSNAAARRYHGD